MNKNPHHHKRKNTPKHPTGQGTLRIIGGKWRSRKLAFAEVEGLRPTPDRVRETLFNWLQHDIDGSVCLDLFCGSGALGLEALSRGAKQVTFVDRELPVIQLLNAHFNTLAATGASAIQANAVIWLEQHHPKEPYIDLVFLDPPFRQNWLNPTIAQLIAGRYLKPGAKVYIEMEAKGEDLVLPNTWQQLKSKKAGQIHYSLYEVCSTETSI